VRSTTHRLTPHCPSPSHHLHVLRPSLLSTRRQFSRREWPHHSLRHIMTHSVPTRRTRNSVPSRQCSLKPPMHRVVIRAVPSAVSLPHSYTARILPHLPTHHRAPVWHHLWQHRVRRRIIPSPHRRPRPLLHPPHLHQRPLLAPAPPFLVLPLRSSSPSLSAAQSRTATSRTNKLMGSSTT
jgi:hypothetical protein